MPPFQDGLRTEKKTHTDIKPYVKNKFTCDQHIDMRQKELRVKLRTFLLLYLNKNIHKHYNKNFRILQGFLKNNGEYFCKWQKIAPATANQRLWVRSLHLKRINFNNDILRFLF